MGPLMGSYTHGRRLRGAGEPGQRMASRHEAQETSTARRPQAGRWTAGAAVFVLALAAAELSYPRFLPPGWPSWLLVLTPALLAGGTLLRADRQPWRLLAWAVALAGTGVLLLGWPAAGPALVRTPAPWLLALVGAIGVGAHVGGRAPPVAMLARAVGGFLLAVAGLSMASLNDPAPAPGMSLGLSGTLACLLLGGWLVGRDLLQQQQRMMRLASGLLAGVASLVIIGWWLGVPYIVQGGTQYVPMQFNTATCALLIAVALRLLAGGKRNLALLPLLPVVAIGSISLVEEYTAFAFGVGEWLLRHDIVAEGVVPGRMAPNTSVAFLLACLGIALAPAGDQDNLARWSATWACGFVAAVIALIVLAGYALGIPVLRGWGSQTPMALMTGVCLLLVGIGLGFGGAEYRPNLRQPVGWMPLAVAAASIAVSVMVWYAINREQAVAGQAALARQAELTEQALANGIIERRRAVRRLAERLSAAGDEARAIQVFDLDAEIYLRDFSSLVTVMWTDTETRVLRQQLREGEGVSMLGRRVDFEAGRAELFKRARGSREAVESQPLPLLDRGMGEMVAAPVMQDGRTVGFVVTVMRYETLFPSLLASISESHPLQIRHQDIVLFERGEPGEPGAVYARDVDVYGDRLDLLLWPEGGEQAPVAKLLLFTILATGGLLALALRLAGQARQRADDAETRGRELAAQVRAAEQARGALLQAERELSSVFESISDAFFTLDLEWRFVFVNPRAEALMHKRREELVGRLVWEAFPDALDSVIEREFRAAVSGERAGEFEVHFAPLGAWFYVRVYPHPQGLAVYFQDISDRKRAELEAQRAQAASDRAKRLAQLGSWDYDLGSGTLNWSPEVFRIFGLPAAHASPGLAGMLQHVHFEDRGRVQAAHGRLHRGEGELDLEYRVLRPDGETRHVRELGTLVRDAAGKVVSASGAVQDITDRHKAEDALRELSRRLEQSLVMNRMVLENSLDVICVIDANGRFRQVSNACQALWGFAPGELVGRAHYDLAHPDDRAETLREGAAVLAGRPTLDFRNRIVAKDGRVVAMQWSAVWSARERMMFAIARDVTDAQRQAQALQDARDSLERAQRIARMGAWEYDLVRDQFYWSDEVYRIFQVSPGEFEGNFQAFAARVHPEDLRRLQELQAQTVAGGPDLDVEHRIVLPGGAVGYVHQRASLLRDDQGRPWKISGSVQDITERKLAQIMEEGQRLVLDAIAKRRPLPEVLLMIVRLAERQLPGALSSVLLLDAAGQHVQMGAAPSLPPEYNAAIHGLAIGPKAGSCGTAAFRGERVVVADIDHDPLWEDYLAVVQPHGLKACWSTPVKASGGRVIATFATYYREVREPDAKALAVIDALASLCAVAIEHAAAFEEIASRR